MVNGAEGCDSAIFLGYRAEGGTEKATFDHAFSGSMIDWIRVNGIEATEYFINGLALGHYDVPVILVAGDEALMKDPDIERLALKSAVSRYTAKSKSLRLVKKELTYACTKALERFRMGAIKPMKAKEPIKIEMRFIHTQRALIAQSFYRQ